MNEIINKIERFRVLEVNLKEIDNEISFLKSTNDGSSKYSFKELVQIELDDKIDEKSKINKEIILIKNYVNDNKNNVGIQINEQIDTLVEDIDFYKSNKSFENLKLMIDKINETNSEIESLYNTLLFINTAFEPLDNTNTSHDIKNIRTMNEINSNEDEKKSVPNNNGFILNPNLELGQYTLNNKLGYSLKDFGYRYKKDIEKVLVHFDYDLEMTINYFKSYHGLCPGSHIEKNSFKAICGDLIKKEPDLHVYIDKKKIEANNLKNVFINSLLAIGLDKIYEQCQSLFGMTFNVSKTPIKSDQIVVEKYCNDTLFYIKIHGSQAYLKNLLNKIKNELNLVNLEIY